MFIFPLAAALLVAQPAAQADVAEAPAPAESAAWREAAINRPLIKTAPAFVDGPRAQLPEAEKVLGHHGPVVIQGIIGIDGRMIEARVKQTSHAPVLDQIALDAAMASTFTPARDVEGTPLPIVIAMPFDLVAYKSEQGMGILQYTCDQFVRDMDWWKSVNPDKSFKEHELYLLESGLDFASAIQRAGKDREALNKAGAGFEQRWEAAIACCRKKPHILQRDAIFR